ncbi:MAG: hypothetical protein WAW37_01375 [Syntrophobacteraceae bacterium]
MDFGRIALNEIDWEDRSFEIRAFRDDARLRESLARHGMLDPPWIVRKGGRCSIVDGFKRLAWARETGARDAACLFLPQDLAVRDIWERRIEKKLFEGGLDLAEKAQIATVLLELYPAGDAPGPLLAALGISSRRGMIEKWARLCAAGALVLELLGSGEIAERTAIEVSDWDPESRAAVLALLRSLRCSASIQVEIAERINEVSIREEKSRLDVLDGPEIREILSNNKLNHRQKTLALRDLLARLRYPRLSQRERKFRRDIESLSLPPSVRIAPPPAFEGDGWRMELSFSSPDELRSAINAAGKLAGSNRLDRIFEPEREERS